MSSTATPSYTSLRNRLATAWHLFLNYAYDYRRFRSASFIEGSRTRENRRAHIHLLSHTLEYGMSLSDSRKGFGMEKVRMLCAEMQRYLSAYGRDETMEMALAVLTAHIAFTVAQGADVSETRTLLEPMLVKTGPVSSIVPGGTEQVRAAEIARHARIDFLSFMEKRNSVRQYADRAITFRKSPEFCFGCASFLLRRRIGISATNRTR